MARWSLAAATVVYVAVVVVLCVEGAWLLAAFLGGCEAAVWAAAFFREPAGRRLRFRWEAARFARTGRAPAWRRRTPPAEPRMRDREESP